MLQTGGCYLQYKHNISPNAQLSYTQEQPTSNLTTVLQSAFVRLLVWVLKESDI